MTKVLLIRFSALGDIVLTLKSAQALQASGVEVHFLTKESFRPIVAASGFVKNNHIHTLSNGASLSELLSTVKRLKSTFVFDRVYDLHRNLRSLIVSLCFGIFRVKRVSKHRFCEYLLFFLRARGYRALGFEPLNRTEDSLRLVLDDLRRANKKTSQNSLDSKSPFLLSELPELSLDVSKGVELLKENVTKGAYICIAPESAWSQKEWPVERFIAVAQELSQQGYAIVWLGLKPLSHDAETVKGSINLCGKLSILQTARVLSQSKLLICNDSGLMHVAEGVNCPVVAVFGPTTTELGFARRTKSIRIVESKLWCRPCSKTGKWCIQLLDRQKCLKQVHTSNVLLQSFALLNEPEMNVGPSTQ